MKSNIITIAKQTLHTEADAIYKLAEQIPQNFEQAINLLLQCQGKVICIGMGKSGHIANKIAATLASTGTPSFFMHPAEANHGDLGMIQKHDVLIMISNSGETSEILSILPSIKRLKTPIIGISSNSSSTLAQKSDIHIEVKIQKEACPHNLAPTTSTTAVLALGDAIAICLLNEKGFSQNDFAISHPGGSLGKKLLTRIKDVMRINDKIPMVEINSSFSEVLLEITAKGLGMTAIVNNKTDKELIGIFTDGDLRRLINNNLDFSNVNLKELINYNPKTIGSNEMASFAVSIMEDHAISQLLVVENNTLVGALNMQDLLLAKII